MSQYKPNESGILLNPGDAQPDRQTNEPVDRRSRKYVPLTDEEIVQLALKKNESQRDKVFLSREIDYRNLNEQVTQARKEQTRAIYKKPIWKILALVIVAVFALSRQMGGLF